MGPSSASSSRRRSSVAAPSASRVYLDYAGFAPIDPRAIAVMRTFLEGGVGNPGAPHTFGREARDALDAARVKVARLVGATPAGVIFTSGATEANNLAIAGVAARAAGRHIVTSAVEHVSVLNPCRALENRGFSVTYVGVDADGRVDPDAVAGAIRDDTVLVSLMAGNGEVGTLQAVAEVGRIAHAHDLPFHVDGVHATGRIPLDVEVLGVDLLSFSSNDLYGPPGAGALWVRPGIKVAPVVLGGGQENGFRSGAENVPAIVGMGVAADIARADGDAEAARLGTHRDRLLDGLLAQVPGARRTGAPSGSRLPHHASVVMPGVKAEAVLLELDVRGLAASSGSACATLTGQPSHVLRAIGCSADEAEASLCFTLGRWTTDADVEAALALVPAAVARLRALSPR